MKKPFILVSVLMAWLSITAAAGRSEREAPLSIVAEESDGEAVIRISGYINEWGNANAVDLGVRIDALNAKGYSEATVFINTKGGQTWEANEIVNELKRFKGKLNGVGRAMVFSAGTYIACKLDTFKVHRNTQWMWHKPKGSFEGTADEIESNNKALKQTEADYLRVYAEKTGKKEAELKAAWDKGDQWLMGQEIVDYGFADGTVPEDSPISENDVMELRAIGAPVVPVATAKRTTQKPQKMEIDPTTIGLPADATQEQINAKLKELKAQAAKAEQLEQEKRDSEKTALEASVKETLDQAEKDRKITAENRKHWEKTLTADLETGKAMIEGLAPVAALGDEIDPPAPEGVSGPDARKDWSLEDWQKKDPEGLEAMHDKDPKKFEKLFEAGMA